MRKRCYDKVGKTKAIVVSHFSNNNGITIKEMLTKIMVEKAKTDIKKMKEN